MKIGIITFWDSNDNYGQLLQSYALQAYLKEIGHEALIIRYKKSVKKRFEIKKFSPSHIVSYIKFKWELRNKRKINDIERDFNTFRQSISYSEKIYHGFTELMKEDWSQYDIFICGSDQIWSPKSDDELKSYFLQFAPFQAKSIAYAPSFGRDKIALEYEEKLKTYLRNFDAISVREETGVDIIKNAGFKSELVCDPTLLLSSTHYKDRFIKSAKKNNKSAFLYFINWDTEISFSIIDKYLKDNNYNPKLFATDGLESPWNLYNNQSPESWLNNLANAEISIVNSFHGLVFSILFHIPFAVALLGGEHSVMNNRINSVLAILGLDSRIISKENSLENIFHSVIDWESVDEKLEKFRLKSLQFLSSSLDGQPYNDRTYNICFLTSGSVHHCYGGLDRVTEILADNFEADGHKVHYISLRNRGKFDKKRQIFLPDSSNIRGKENSEFLSKFLIDKKIDFLINQEANVNMCIPLNSNVTTKVISCLHFNPNYIDDRHFNLKFRDKSIFLNRIGVIVFSLNFINKWGLHHLRHKLGVNYERNLDYCDKLVLLSYKFKRSIINLLENKDNIYKLEAINNPINSYKENKDINIENKDKNILFVGRLDNNFKRIDELIKIVGKLLKDNPDWSFIVCGDGPDREYLMDIGSQESDRIIFLGYCDPEEFYKKSSILVLKSSKSEGWGMVIVEGMEHGVVPVVADTYESLPDIIDNGLDGIITRDNQEDFAVQLSNLMKDEEKRKIMSGEAMKKIKRFEASEIINQWYRLFRKC